MAFALIVLASVAASAQQLSPTLQSAVGHWQVINDSGKPWGHVEIYLAEGKLFGKVTQLRPGRHPGDVCEKCSGELKNQPIKVWSSSATSNRTATSGLAAPWWIRKTARSTKERFGRLVRTSCRCAASSAYRCWDAPKLGHACRSPSPYTAEIWLSRLRSCPRTLWFRSAHGDFQSEFEGYRAQPGYCPPIFRT